MSECNWRDSISYMADAAQHSSHGCSLDLATHYTTHTRRQQPTAVFARGFPTGADNNSTAVYFVTRDTKSSCYSCYTNCCYDCCCMELVVVTGRCCCWRVAAAVCWGCTFLHAVKNMLGGSAAASKAQHQPGSHKLEYIDILRRNAIFWDQIPAF